MENLRMTEGKLQADCYLWFHDTYTWLRGLLYHVPNGGKRDKREAAIMKAKGVVAGIPDLVFHYKARTYFFELKDPNGKGKVSDAQTRIHAALEAQAFEVWVIDSLNDFKATIAEIMSRKDDYKLEVLIDKDEYYYSFKIYDYLYSLDGGRVVKIAEIVSAENYPKFYKAVLSFIEGSYGHAEGFEVLFTPDYLALYKKEFNSFNDIVYNGKATI